MKTWIAENRDKILLGGGSLIVAGVVGYFSGVSAVKSDLARMGERVAAVEAELETSVHEKIITVESNENRIAAIEFKLNALEAQIDISAQMTELLKVRLEQERQNTLRELRSYQDYGKEP